MGEITYSKPTWVNGSGTKINAANLQAISDALDQATHSASRVTAGTTLDADTVSGYGIGAIRAVGVDGAGASIKALQNGIYRVSLALGAANFPIGNNGTLLVMRETSDYATYLYFRGSTPLLDVWIQKEAAGNLTGWSQMFNSGTDGNGGQPPAPKPQTTSSSSAGYFKVLHSVDNGTLSETGTWYYEYAKYASTDNVLQHGSRVVGSGALSANAAGSGYYWDGWAVKLS